MASMKYGALNANPTTIEKGVAASEVFHHSGANIVYLDGSGFITQALTATATVFGMALVPTGMGAGVASASWKSSATAGADKVPVIPASEGYSFLLPSDGTPTVAQGGNACDYLNASATDATAGLVDIGTSVTDIFVIVGPGTEYKADASATDVVVKFNQLKIQTDT